jgi:hypothetical protein
LVRSAELRQQKWVVKRNELELIYARNQVLPQLDVGALYRWVGVGDELIRADRNGLDFPAVGSNAFDVLTGGRFQEFAFFLNFQMPVGVRSALSGVRRAQLALAQSKERLKDMELNTSHLLATAVRNMDSNYWLAQSHFNRMVASRKEVEATFAQVEVEYKTLDIVLDAQRRRAQAQFDFYRALCDYNKSIAEVQFRKGSLLEYNNICLAEGPWTEKAYWDALERARERDASYSLDYGWTRPRVMSRGPIQQHFGRAVETIEAEEAPPEPIPTPTPSLEAPDLPEPITSQPGGPLLEAPAVGEHAVGKPREIAARPTSEAFPWGALGLSEEPEIPVNVLRLTSYNAEEEPSTLRPEPLEERPAEAVDRPAAERPAETR